MRRRIASRLLAVATSLVLAAPRVSAAQGGGAALDVEGGAAALSERGIPASAVGTAGASLRASGRRAGLAASTLGACSAGVRCAVQGIATAAVYAPPDQGARWEAAVSGSGFALDGELPVSSAQVELREYLDGGDRGAYVGGGGGLVHGGITRATTAFEIGGWWRAHAGQFTADARVMRVPVTRPPPDSTHPAQPLLAQLATFGDLSAGWQLEGDDASLSASAGWRFASNGAGPAAAGGGWATLSATRWVAPRLAIVAAVGRALEDPTRGTPAARFASISVRVRLHAPSPPSVGPRERTGPVVSVAAAGDSARRLDVQVAGATSVEVMADFTDWNAVPLERAGDVWRLVKPIAPGPHRLALRIDGGAWQAPANLPTVRDEFGGIVGLVTVP